MSPDILTQIAEEFGTPCYVYDLDRIKEQFDTFKAAFPWPALKICYAMKANYNHDILRLLKSMGSGIDAVSPGDLYMAEACGFKPDDIIYTANNITNLEMKEIMATGVLMNIGSLSRLEKYGQTFPGTRVCLRFNPDVVDGEHDKIKTGGSLTKFGILLEDAPKAAAIARQHDLTVAGLHEHTGSGLQRPESLLQAMEKIMSVATRENFPNLSFMDFGGGFKVPYRPGEAAVDLKTIGREAIALFSDFCRRYGRELGLWFEPGKYLTAQAGVLLVRVNTIRENRGRIICGTDSGFPQLIRPMFYDAHHEIMNLTHPDGEPVNCDICGNICETGDLFAKDRPVSRIRENDLLAIENAGAYCYAMGGNYNLRPMPAEVVIENKKFRLSRKRQTSRELVTGILSESAVREAH